MRTVVLAVTWILWQQSLRFPCTPDGWCPAPTVVELVLPPAWQEQRRYDSKDACFQAWRRLEDQQHERWWRAQTRAFLWAAPYEHGTDHFCCLPEGTHPAAVPREQMGPPPQLAPLRPDGHS